ncbi:hypothetical protein MRB53_023522 [Persea americana]|uniref:Uncharacterized protein n=1 Tax=Persea americana TaxID=3435 RepID=A0ACC2L9R3_PERAE|nr:hypothetical protein MRB53_023522 [Persea americana]
MLLLVVQAVQRHIFPVRLTKDNVMDDEYEKSQELNFQGCISSEALKETNGGLHCEMGCVCLASFSVEDWRCPVCPLGSKSSPWQMQTLAMTLSYLIYDFLCCLFDNHISLDNSVHHIVSIVGIGAGLVYEMCGSEMVVALWLTEISSPFLHIRELLKELGYKDTDLNLIADITFAVVFSVARMVVGPYLMYVTVMSDNNPLLVKAMAVGLQAVSAFWFYKIVRMVRYKLLKRKGTKKA